MPGRSLPIRQVASRLQTSPMPVREALRQLVTERAIAIMPNRSFSVPMLTLEAFREILKVRIELEGLAAAMACANADDELVQRLKDLEADMDASQAGNDNHHLILVNQRFHFEIYTAAQSRVLLPFIESLWLQVGPYIPFVYEDDDFQMSLNHHEAIIEAISKRDAEFVRTAIAEDLSTAAAVIEARAPFAK